MSTIIVYNNASEGNGTLYEALSNANTNDEIIFDSVAFPSTEDVTIYLTSTLSLKKDVILTGVVNSEDSLPKIVIDGQNLDSDKGVRGFTLSANAVVSNFIFENCYTTGQGGGLIVSGANKPIINNCIFRNNIAKYGGGAACGANSLTIFNNCSFKDNTSVKSGGGLYATRCISVKLFKCEFLRNLAEANGAGAGMSLINVNDIVIEKCTCEDNSTQGIYIQANGSLLLKDIYSANKGGFDVSFHNASTTKIQISGKNLFGNTSFSDSATLEYIEPDTIVAISKLRFDTNVAITLAGQAGYFAVPKGSYPSQVTVDSNADIRLCHYGANVHEVEGKSNLGQILWTADKTNVPILIEQKSDDGWVVVTDSATDCQYDIADYEQNEVYQYRLFDGYQRFFVTLMYQESSGSNGYYYFLNNADSGEGSLRQALLDSDEGLTIAPSKTLNVDKVKIYLLDELFITKKQKIEGLGKRIELSGATLYGDINSQLTLNNCDLLTKVIFRGEKIELNNCRVFQTDNAILSLKPLSHVQEILINNSLIYSKSSRVFLLEQSRTFPISCTITESTILNSSNQPNSILTEQDKITYINSLLEKDPLKSIKEVEQKDASTSIFVSADEMGFVAYDFTNDFLDNDYHLSDSSPYISSGDVELTTGIDLGYTPRVHYIEVDGVANVGSSLGAYENAKYDLYWIGKDAIGSDVTTVSFNSNIGWATEIDADVCGTVAPDATKTIYITRDAKFIDAIQAKAIAVAPNVTVELNGSRTTSIPVSIILHKNAKLTVGANEKLSIPVFYSATGATFVISGDLTLKNATIEGALDLEHGSKLTLEESTISIDDKFTIESDSIVTFKDCNVNFKELDIQGTLNTENCEVSGSKWTISGVYNSQNDVSTIAEVADVSGALQVINGSWTGSVPTVTGTVTFQNAEINADTLNSCQITTNQDVTIKKGNAVELTMTDGTLKFDELEVSKITTSNSIIESTGTLQITEDSSFTDSDVKVTTKVDAGTNQLVINNSALEVGMLSGSNIEIDCVNKTVKATDATAKTVNLTDCTSSFKTLDANDIIIDSGTIALTTVTGADITLSNATATGGTWTFGDSDNLDVSGGSLTLTKIVSTELTTLNLNADEFKVTTFIAPGYDLNVENSTCNFKEASVKTATFKNAEVDITKLNVETNLSIAKCTSFTIGTMGCTNIYSNDSTLEGDEWTLVSEWVSNSDQINVKKINAPETANLVFTNSAINPNTITGGATLSDLTLVDKTLEADSLHLDTLTITGGAVKITEFDANSVTTDNTELSGETWDISNANLTSGSATIGELSGGTLIIKDVELDCDKISGDSVTIESTGSKIDTTTLVAAKVAATGTETQAVELDGKDWNVKELSATYGNAELEQVETDDLTLNNTTLTGTTITSSKATIVDSDITATAVNLTSGTVSGGSIAGELNIHGQMTFSNVKLSGASLILYADSNVTFEHCELDYETIYDVSRRITSMFSEEGRLGFRGDAKCQFTNCNIESDNLLVIPNAKLQLSNNVVTAYEILVNTIISYDSKITAVDSIACYTLLDPVTTLTTKTLRVVQECSCQNSVFDVKKIDLSIPNEKVFKFSGIDFNLDLLSIDGLGSFEISGASSLVVKKADFEANGSIAVTGQISINVLNGSGYLELSANEYVGESWSLYCGLSVESDSFHVTNLILDESPESKTDDPTYRTLAVSNDIQGGIWTINQPLKLTGSTVALTQLTTNLNSFIQIDSKTVKIDELHAGVITGTTLSGTTWNVNTILCDGSLNIDTLEVETLTLKEEVEPVIIEESQSDGEDNNANPTETTPIQTPSTEVNQTIKATSSYLKTKEITGINAEIVSNIFETMANAAILLSGGSLICDSGKLDLTQCQLEDYAFFTVKQITEDSALIPLTSESRGYFATVPTDLSRCTVNGNVHLCHYGAQIKSISAALDEEDDVTIELVRGSDSNPDAGALVELQIDDSDWEIKENALLENSCVISAAEPETNGAVRVFDGLKFIVNKFWTITNVQYKVVMQMITPESETPVAMGWEDDMDLDESSIQVKVNQSITILARIYNAFGNNKLLLNKGTNITSVKYSVERYRQGLFNNTVVQIPGHTEQEAGADCILTSRSRSEIWTKDDKGFTFVLTPATRDFPIFPEEGAYRIAITITLAKGNPIVFYGLAAVDV